MTLYHVEALTAGAWNRLHTANDKECAIITARVWSEEHCERTRVIVIAWDSDSSTGLDD